MNRLREAVVKLLPDRVKRFIKAVIFLDSSESGETNWLRKLVAEFECNEWVIDVGAHDGVSLSNSLPFIKRGWRAILIEPAPEVFSKLKRNHGGRKNVTCLDVACSDKGGEGELFSDGKGGYGATLCKDDNEWCSRARSSRSVMVKTDTITSILKNHQAPSQPGILLVDCEGMDYEVLLGLDFEQFRPTVIVTEEYEWELQKHAAKYSLLILANYSLFQKVGSNTIWIDRAAVKRQ